MKKVKEELWWNELEVIEWMNECICVCGGFVACYSCFPPTRRRSVVVTEVNRNKNIIIVESSK